MTVKKSPSFIRDSDHTYLALVRRPACDVWPELMDLLKSILQEEKTSKVVISHPKIEEWLNKEHWTFTELDNAYKQYINSLGFVFE